MKKTKLLFNVRSDLYRAAFLVVSDEEARPYLHGVRIEPHPIEGVLLIATDGYRMVVAHDRDGFCAAPLTVSIKGDALKAGRVKRADRAKAAAHRFVADSISLVRALPDGTEYACEWQIDGTYPDWRRVLPKAADLKYGPNWGAFNAAYFGDFAKVANEVSDSARIGVRSRSSEDGALITFESDDLFGILMPMRVDSDRTYFPYFMSPKYRPLATPAPAKPEGEL